MKQSIYMDYAAATPLDERVLAAMKPYFSEIFYNPSATYLAGGGAKAALGEARSKIARIIGAKPAEIIFTAGATEANNLAIQGVMSRFPKAEVVTSAIEHESVLAPAQKCKNRVWPVDAKGTINLAKFDSVITHSTVLVSVMYVNNELGTIQPLGEIANILRQIRIQRGRSGNKLPIYLHADAAQAANFLDLHTSRLGVDMMSINGGKIYGPKQTGVLYINSGVELEPLILGGGQERGLRSGTENIAGAVGLAAALELTQAERGSETARLKNLRDLFIKGLKESVPAAEVNGSLKHTAPHILSASFPGIDNERLMIQLDGAGVIAAVGSACSASSQEPSHVLKAIGLNDEQARSTLRFSFGKATTPKDIAFCLAHLKRFTSV